MASHALFCMTKVCGGRPLTSPDEEQVESLLLRALAKPATPPLSGRDISKAASALSKLWPLCSRSSAPSAFAAALAGLDESCCADEVGEGLDAQAIVGVLHAHGTVGRAPTADSMRTLQRKAANKQPPSVVGCSSTIWRRLNS